jgi:hypothetical protein
MQQGVRAERACQGQLQLILNLIAAVDTSSKRPRASGDVLHYALIVANDLQQHVEPATRVSISS